MPALVVALQVFFLVFVTLTATYACVRCASYQRQKRLYLSPDRPTVNATPITSSNSVSTVVIDELDPFEVLPSDRVGVNPSQPITR